MSGIQSNKMDPKTYKAVVDHMVDKVLDLNCDLQKLNINEKNLETLCQNKILEVLNSLAINIIPRDEYLKAGTENAERVLNLMKKKSKFKIGRVCHAGSSGKKTTIENSDFDCVLFINHEEPIFEDVLDDLENILMLNTDIVNMRQTKFSLQFELKGFEFDFLPAPNFIQNSQLSGDELIDLQQKLTLDKIKKDPKKYRYSYSSGLSEANVRFMEKQEGFVNEMVRLAKFWYSSLYFFDEYISGAKLLVETVMVYAVNKQAVEKKTHLECFSKFLTLISQFDELNVIFEEEYKNFPIHPIPDYIKKQKPLVLEPVNPYNNLAKYWGKPGKAKELLEQYASTTMARLKKIIELVAHSGGTDISSMVTLFLPQPHVAPIKKYFKANFLCGVTTENIKNPDCKVRIESLWKVPEFVSDLEQFRSYMYFMIKCYEAIKRGQVKSAQEIQSKVGEFIDVNIRGAAHKPWVSAAGNHEDYDVTLSIPLQTEGVSYCVKISWKQ